MTKKEKEEMERKQRSKNKTKNIMIIVLIALLIAFIAFFLFKEGIINFGEKNTTTTEPTNSVSDSIDNNSNNNNSGNNYSNPADDNDKEDNSTSEETSSDEDITEDERPNKNDGSVYAASLPLTVDDALSILNSRYGKGYRINMSTSGDGYNNFAVFKDDERYATVSVNLSTGDATERITDTGKETKFNLLKGE